MTAEHTTVPALAMACMNRKLVWFFIPAGAVLRRIVQGQTERRVSVG
jgi:hypothetical protein